MQSEQGLDEVREFLVLDSLAQGVPEDLDSIVEWVQVIDPQSKPDYQRLQKRAQLDDFEKDLIGQTLVELCRAGHARALVTDSEGAITAEVDNDPTWSRVGSYYFEITHRGKLRWKELETKLEGS